MRLEVVVAEARARGAALARLRGKRRGGAALAGGAQHSGALRARRLQGLWRKGGAAHLRQRWTGSGSGQRVCVRGGAQRKRGRQGACTQTAGRDAAVWTQRPAPTHPSTQPHRTLVTDSVGPARWRSSRLRPEGEAAGNIGLESVPKGMARLCPLAGEDRVSDGLRRWGRGRVLVWVGGHTSTQLSGAAGRRRRRPPTAAAAAPLPRACPMHVGACTRVPAGHRAFRGRTKRVAAVAGRQRLQAVCAQEGWHVGVRTSL